MSGSAFPNLFNPIQVGSKTLKHRLNFGAHTANMEEGGRLPGRRHKGYYLERAIGGAAMIVVEPMPVHKSGVFIRGGFRAEDDAVIPHFREITDAVKDQDTVILQQLLHIGAHGDYDNSYHPNWSPSGFVSYHDSDGSRAMRAREVEEVAASYITAAQRCKEAGFDGIELFAAYNALIDQFWSPLTNSRDDKWGGDFDRRMAFSQHITEGIRAACGPDFVIGIAITGDDKMPGGLNNARMAEIAAWHDERHLMDYITVGTGSYYDFSSLIPTALYEDKLGPPLAEGIKQAVTHAKVQAESHIRTPENADYVIASAQADMVSIVRGQIADPHMATKAAEGRVEDIRPCISCNQMCWGRRYRDYAISCLVNPSVSREWEWGGDRFEATETPREVLVVGGGPAGMEAARVAAARGHKVTLAEASDKLGGQFRLAGLQPRRGQITDLIQWYETQLQKHQVKILYNCPMEAEDVLETGADAVVLATGSLPDGAGFQRWFPDVEALPGVEKPNVFSTEDVMGKSARLGHHVILLDEGGNWKGAGTAWAMAEEGHKVTIITPHPVEHMELQRTSSDYPLRERLKKLGAETVTNAGVRAWTGTAATIIDLRDGTEGEIAADSLVLACTNVSERWLADSLIELAPDLEVHEIGDGVAPRLTPAATYEGRMVGRMI